MAQIYALTEMIDGCDGVMDRMFDDGRYAEAEATARRCGDPRHTHLALVLQGKLDEAAGFPVPRQGHLEMTSDGLRARMLADLPDAVALIATGRWSAAAEAATARAASIRATPRAPDASPTPDAASGPAPANPAAIELTARHYQCVAELFRHHAGDAGAANRLRALTVGPGGATCAPVLFEIASDQERQALLAQASHDTVLRESAALLTSLAWLHGDVDSPDSDGSQRFDSPEAVLAHPEGRGFLASFSADMWLAAVAAPSLRSIAMLRWRTVAQVFDGDLTAAAATAQEARALAAANAPRAQLEALQHDGEQLLAEVSALPRVAKGPGHDRETKALHQRLAQLEQRSDDLARRRSATLAKLRDAPFDPGDAELLPALVALHTPSTSLALPPAVLGDTQKLDYVRTLYPQLMLRRGDPTGDGYAYDKTALHAAQQGDGRELASALGAPYRSLTDEDVMAVFPRITTGRDAVARQLTWSTPSTRPSTDSDHFPFNLALHAVARRDALRIAGSPDAERWDAIYRRLATVFRNRQKLVALLLWQL
jgi:hypothetical protein